jgi:hypothetical protein
MTQILYGIVMTVVSVIVLVFSLMTIALVGGFDLNLKKSLDDDEKANHNGGTMETKNEAVFLIRFSEPKLSKTEIIVDRKGDFSEERYEFEKLVLKALSEKRIHVSRQPGRLEPINEFLNGGKE